MANPRLVNKQFNSPIGLYSESNLREVIERESQILANGAVGINFNNPATGKPANLQNSAVLRMLEEEERHRNGHGPGVKRVAWPPNEGGEYLEQNAVQTQGGPQYSTQAPVHQQQAAPARSPTPLKPLNISTARGPSPNQLYQSPGSPLVNQSPTGFRPQTPNKQWAPVQSPVHTPQNQFYTHPPQYQQQPQQQQQYQAPAPQYQPAQQQYQQPQYQQPQQQFQQPQYQQPQYQQPQQQYQPPQQQYQQPQYQQPQQQYQPPQQQYQQPQQQYQAPAPQYQPAAPQYQQPQQQQQYQAAPQQQFNQPSQLSAQSVAAPAQVAPRLQSSPVSRAVEPPPSTITLRPQAPVSQAPPPLITSQPATATLKGGKHLRGDMKWPPENVKSQMEEENRQRIELARGPAFRPRKVRKDYTQFFAQHALNSTYPGYKIPPGTQFYKPE